MNLLYANLKRKDLKSEQKKNTRKLTRDACFAMLNADR